MKACSKRAIATRIRETAVRKAIVWRSLWLMAFSICPVMQTPVAGAARSSRLSAAAAPRTRLTARAARESERSGGEALALAAALSLALLVAQPAHALNRFEESRYGEFDRGSAKQFGAMVR